MKFKISKWNVSDGHNKTVTCAAWNSSNGIFSCGEDHMLIHWYLESGNIHGAKLAQFDDNFLPTYMEWSPRSLITLGTELIKPNVLLIGTSDGKLHFINENGRIEKTVESHKGALFIGKLSFDGSTILTAGEDGMIKIWSRSGVLRSTIVRGTQPVLAASWNHDSKAILYSQGRQLAIQSLNSGSKPHKWYAHDGNVLVVSWNRNNGIIVSGGEDCRYKLWDCDGNQLYSSGVTEHPITAVNWCPNGSYFAVGAYNTIKLCDKTGWTHSLEKAHTGSIYSISWSNDSTQLAMACGNSTVSTAHVIDRSSEWKNFIAILVRRKTIQVREVGSERLETLEISEKVVHLEFAFDRLVVVTPSECHIYSLTNWNTPTIFNLKNAPVSAVLLAEKHLLFVEWNVLTLYSYQGRLLHVPKWKGMTHEPLYQPCIALCSDTLIIRDQSNEKLLHMFDLSSNKPSIESRPHSHPSHIVEVAVNHIGTMDDRQLAVIDESRDLYLISIGNCQPRRIYKIASLTRCIAWAKEANVLAAMLDTTLTVWLCPNYVHYGDRALIRKTQVVKGNSEYGKQSSIVRVQNGTVTVRRGDGALVTSSFYTFFTSLHRHITTKDWQKALSLCRIAQNEILWSCLALMAAGCEELSVAEEGYAAINRYDKVDHIQKIKKMSNQTKKLVQISLLAGDVSSAEDISIQNGLISDAVRTNIQMYKWDRALKLATRRKKFVEQITEARNSYLISLGMNETNPSFLEIIST